MGIVGIVFFHWSCYWKWFYIYNIHHCFVFLWRPLMFKYWVTEKQLNGHMGIYHSMQYFLLFFLIQHTHTWLPYFTVLLSCPLTVLRWSVVEFSVVSVQFCRMLCPELDLRSLLFFFFNYNVDDAPGWELLSRWLLPGWFRCPKPRILAARCQCCGSSVNQFGYQSWNSSVPTLGFHFDPNDTKIPWFVTLFFKNSNKKTLSNFCFSWCKIFKAYKTRVNP